MSDQAAPNLQAMSADKIYDVKHNAVAQQKDTFDFYQGFYEKGRSPWHRPVVNWSLVKYYDALVPLEEPLEKVLVPLCGKTVDIKYLADQGHEVVGVEFCEKPIREIFERDNIKYEEEEVPAIEGKLFKSSNGKIKVYCCDFFKFTPQIEGHFKCVWESGAQIEDENRLKYYKHMNLLTAPGCRWLTCLTSYDASKFYGIPYSVPYKQVKDNMGDFEIVVLERRSFDLGAKCVNEHQQMMQIFMKMRHLEASQETVYLFVKKR